MMEYLCFFILLLFILKCFSKPLIIRNLPHCSLKVEVGTQTDFTDQEAYLREIIDNNNKKIHNSNRKLTNSSANCKIPSCKVTRLVKDCLTLKTVRQKIPMLLFIQAFKAGTF